VQTMAMDYDVPDAVPDSIQDIAWSPNSNVIVAGSWDNAVRCWEVQQNPQNMAQFNAVARAQITHKGPVLCTSFSGVCKCMMHGYSKKIIDVLGCE